MGDDPASPIQNPKSKIQNPLDMEVLESLRALQTAGAPDLLSELIDLFLVDMPALIDAMRAAIAAGDATALQRAAHSGKGSSANLGAPALARLCKAVEDLGRSGATADAADWMARVEAEYARVAAALEREREQVAV